MPSIGRVLAEAHRSLEQAGLETPRLDAEVLLAHALGLPREDILGKTGRELDPDAKTAFGALIERRKKREPVARITGVQEFWSLPFKVNAATLVPRPDSETLVEAALKKIPKARPWRILDLGTGSGCLLLSLLSERPQASGLGVDLSEKALHCAAENAKTLGLWGRTKFSLFDWRRDKLPAGSFEVVIANPPYIPTLELKTLAPEVKDHGPRSALDGGEDGLDHIRAIAPLAFGGLKEKGRLFLEIGHNQGPAVLKLLKKTGFRDLEIHRDLAGKSRVVEGLKRD